MTDGLLKASALQNESRTAPDRTFTLDFTRRLPRHFTNRHMNKEKQNLAAYHAELDNKEWIFLTVVGFILTFAAVFVGHFLAAV